jgi:hypothetical protein
MVQLGKIPFVKTNGAIRFNPEAIRVWAAGQQGQKKAALRTRQEICSRKRRGAMTEIEKAIKEARKAAVIIWHMLSADKGFNLKLDFTPSD